MTEAEHDARNDATNAAHLHELTRRAARFAGYPAWPSPETPGAIDRLTFPANEDDAGEPVWGLVPEGEEEDFVPLDAAMAEDLIREHLRTWLLDRGWQVQARVRMGRREWRLTDCLAVIDGGGDRLAADYPSGDDELPVLCASVVAVARHAVSAGRPVAG